MFSKPKLFGAILPLAKRLLLSCQERKGVSDTKDIPEKIGKKKAVFVVNYIEDKSVPYF